MVYKYLIRDGKGLRLSDTGYRLLIKVWFLSLLFKLQHVHLV